MNLKPPPKLSLPRIPAREVVVGDLRASLVVFLVALPLCLGVALASGAPPALGLVTGVVGGLLVGALPGSKLQVSGPAAGLTVLVFGLIQDHGLAALGPAVLLAGVLQLGLAALRLGRWFRAIALPVVHGMLAGIGLIIVAQQLLVLAGSRGTGEGPGDLAAIPAAFLAALGGGIPSAALTAGLLALAVVAGWRFAPERLKIVPAPLAGVAAGALAVGALGLAAPRISLGDGLLAAITLPTPGSLGLLAEPAVLGLAIALALVASAESLLSATAVDRMHSGAPTRYNAELGAQGVGNAVSGLLGALPMTAVIVRSSANVGAGARTRLSRIAHGGWLLLFSVALPGVLGLIPTAALAAVLIMAGIALVNVKEIGRLHAAGRVELALYATTATAVFTLGLLEGVALGLALAALRLLLQLARVEVDSEEVPGVAGGEAAAVRIAGPATFLGVPQVATALEQVPNGRDVHLSLRDAPIVDPSVRDLVEGFRERHEATGARVRVEGDGALSTAGPERAR